MPRAIDWEEVVDTRTFSAVQLKPGIVTALTWNALARWLRAHLVSLPTLIGRESTGLVVMGFHLEYRDRVSMLDCDVFRVRGAFRMMRRGERGQLDIRLRTMTHELAVAQLIVRPVAIRDPVSLGAEPAPMPESLMMRLEDDEKDVASPVRVLPDRLGTVETTGVLLAEHTQPMFIHRHLSEVAEQWSWTEIPALVETSKEALALGAREHAASLRRCLLHRMARFDVEFSRPFFSFEAGRIVTRAYEVAGHLAFVHRLTSGRGENLHATVVEVFDRERETP